jgi:hypothetical protein
MKESARPIPATLLGARAWGVREIVVEDKKKADSTG